MKTLRSKIFLFISLLIILPSLPLSYFVLQLLEESYQIGVNDRVESALEGSLEISADLYQMHKSTLQATIDEIVSIPKLSPKKISSTIETTLDDRVSYSVAVLKLLNTQETLIPYHTIQKYIAGKKQSLIWPNPDHKILYALARLPQGKLLQIIYPLPESFQNSASQIQEVNQIYKTLSFVHTQVRKSFLFTFLIIYSIGLVITLLVLYTISKKITRPIERLTTATKEIGKGNLNYQIKVSGQDEFALLSSSFNNMVTELSENQQKIIELEKMATWQKLARRLAHEIKNPLTPIQLMAQQMRDSYNGDDTKYHNMLNECNEIIEEEVESLKKLVREFSDFARMPEFHIANQSILLLIETIQKLYQQFNMQFELPDYDIKLAYDSEYLKRALINIVDNAIAASDDNKPILLKVTDNNDKIEIAIIDQGEGIEPENLQKIFEPYFSSKQSGVGLGLSIVKKIIEEHQGTIDVASEVGKGTAFKITLPKEG